MNEKKEEFINLLGKDPLIEYMPSHIKDSFLKNIGEIISIPELQGMISHPAFIEALKTAINPNMDVKAGDGITISVDGKQSIRINTDYTSEYNNNVNAFGSTHQKSSAIIEMQEQSRELSVSKVDKLINNNSERRERLEKTRYYRYVCKEKRFL